MATTQKVELSPILNSYVRSKISKQEVNLAYSDYAQAIALQLTDESSYRAFVKKLLPRLAQYGYQPPGMLRQFRQMLVPAEKKDARELLRLASYFVQLIIGDGSAGTPVPLPSSYWNNAAQKAVDTFEDEALVPCWQHAANDKAPLNVRYASLRALAAAARASQTSRPEDPSIVMALLEAVRVALDQLPGSQLPAFVKARGQKRRKELHTLAERAGLQRAVLTAARTGLSRSSVSKIASACIAGATSADKVVARHALAMAAVTALDRPQVCARALDARLVLNIGLFKQTGSLYIQEGQPLPFQFQAASPESRPLNLQDPWARIYLARACGAMVHSNVVRGDVDGVAANYWQTLVILACTDPLDMVAVEAVRCMVGAMAAKLVVLRSVGNSGSRLHPRFLGDDQDAHRAATISKAWRIFMVKAQENSPGQSVLAALGLGGPGEDKKEHKVDTQARFQAVAMQTDPVLRRLVPKFTAAAQAPVVQKVTQRLLQMLGTHAGLCTACRTVAAIAEARATAYEGQQSEEMLGNSSITLALDVLQERMVAVANESLPPSERVLALEALLWLQLPGHPIIIPPSTIMQAMLRGGQTVPGDMRGVVADPWPGDTLSVFLHALLRRLAVSPSLAGYIMECGNCVAAVCPSRVHMEQLQLLWDTALKHPNVQVKQTAFKGAIGMMLMQASPVTQPSSQPLAEVKALAAEEEAGLHVLNRLAALWLGENTGEHAWCSRPQALAGRPSTALPLQEQIALGTTAGNPVVVSVLSSLHLALLTCNWEVKMAAVQAIAKIGARCGEPHRIQCYSILASLQASPEDTCPAPLGVAGLLTPALELMDLIYAAHTVLERLATQIKTQAIGCLPEYAEAAQARHDWLHDLVGRKVGFVPKEIFRIGPAISKLNEESDKDSKASGEEDGRTYSDSEDDTSNMSTPTSGSSSPREPSSPTLAAAPGALMDILAQFTGKADGGRADSSDEDDDTISQAASGFASQPSDPLPDEDAEEVLHPATVLYDFTSNFDEEVSVYKGEKVNMTYELGDWAHVITSDGHQGLVPAEYIQLDGEAEPLKRQPSTAWPTPGSPSRSATSALDADYPERTLYGQESNVSDRTYGYDADAPAYGTNPADDDPWEAGRSGPDGGDAESEATYGGRYGGEHEEEEDSALPVDNWFRTSNRETAGAGSTWGGEDSGRDRGWPFHDAAASAQKDEYGITYGKDEDDWTNDRWASVPEPSSSPRAVAPTSSGGYNPVSDWPPPPSTDRASEYDSYPMDHKGPAGGGGVHAFRHMRSVSGGSSVTSPTSIGSSPSFRHPRRSVEDLPRNPSMSSSSWHAAAGAAPSATGNATPASSVAAAPTTTPAEVMYSFQAEADGELTVTPGDKLVVMGEVDGWLQVVRESDKAVGLVPAEYVQMLG